MTASTQTVLIPDETTDKTASVSTTGPRQDFDLPAAIAQAFPECSQADQDKLVAHVAAARKSAQARLGEQFDLAIFYRDYIRLLRVSFDQPAESEQPKQGEQSEQATVPTPAVETDQAGETEQAGPDEHESAHDPSSDGTLFSQAGEKVDLVAEVRDHIDDISEDEAVYLAQMLYAQLELAVGEILIDGMPDAQLDEFAYFTDQDEARMLDWLAQHDPDYEQGKAFHSLQSGNPDADRLSLIAQYGALKWLQLNRPDYPTVTAVCQRGLLTALTRLISENEQDFRLWLADTSALIGLFDDNTDPASLTNYATWVSHLGYPTSLAPWADFQLKITHLQLDERDDDLVMADADTAIDAKKLLAAPGKCNGTNDGQTGDRS